MKAFTDKELQIIDDVCEDVDEALQNPQAGLSESSIRPLLERALEPKFALAWWVILGVPGLAFYFYQRMKAERRNRQLTEKYLQMVIRKRDAVNRELKRRINVSEDRIRRLKGQYIILSKMIDEHN